MTLVGDVDRLLDRVGDEDEGLALGLDQPEQVLLELAPRLLVHGRERLVHEQHVGVHGKGTGEADALAHPAGELVRVAVLGPGKAHLAQVAAGRLLALRPCHPAQLEAEGGVAQGRGPGEEGEVLEDEGPLGAGAGDRPAVDQDLAARGRDQAGDDLEERGLPAAAGAQKRGELAAGEGEVDVAQRLDAALVDLADAAHLDRGLRCGSLGALSLP